MKIITIELDNDGTSRTEVKLEEMQPVHYCVLIAELETIKLAMINQRNKNIQIKHE
jgi:hypothetical protein